MSRQRVPLVNRRQQIGGRRRRPRRQKVTFGEDRAGLRDVPRAAGRDQHSREPWMKRQPLHLPARLSQHSVPDGAEPFEQRKRGGDAVGVRPLEPFELTWIAAPGEDVQHRGGQIDAVNLRLSMRTQTVEGVP